MAKVKQNRDNVCINGNFDFWQRNSTFNNIGQNVYSADRWMSQNASTPTVNVTRQDISALAIGSQYCLRSERSAGTGAWAILTHFETDVLRRFIGKQVTFSFLLRKGAALTSNVTASINTTNTEASGGTTIDTTSVVIPNASLSSSFQKFSVTLSIPSNTAALGLRVSLLATQTGAANAYFEVTQVMVNEGASSLPFQLAGKTIGGELQLCQRYYEKSYDVDTVPGTNTSDGVITTSPVAGVLNGNAMTGVRYAVPKRVDTNTISIWTLAGVANNVRYNGNDEPVTVVNTGSKSFALANNSGVAMASPATTGVFFHFAASAEL